MIQGDSFRLIVRRGPQPNQSYDLNKDIITLGRDITNDIVINDPEASRHHMRLTRGVSGFSLEDLGSTNGTFVNGQRLSGARPLRPGDMVGLGETVTLLYESVAGVRPSEEAPSAPGMAPAPNVRPSPAPVAPQPQQPAYVQPQPVAQPDQPLYGGYAPPQNQPVQPYNQPAYNMGPAQGVTPLVDVGSEYDPYAVRNESAPNTTRLILIGCVGLSLFCCCSSILGLVLVDQFCLWNRIPIVYDLLRALGYVMVCS